MPTFGEALRTIRNRVLMNIDVKAAGLDRIIDAVVAADATKDVILNVPIDVEPVIAARARALGIAVPPIYLQRDVKVSLDEAMRRAKALRPTLIQSIFDDPRVIYQALDRSKHRRPSSVELPCSFGRRNAHTNETQPRLPCYYRAIAGPAVSLSLRRSGAVAQSFGDQPALKMRDGADELRDQLASCGGGVKAA